LLVTADCGGSNSYKSRAWKLHLQKLADDTRLEISVCHFPPGTSKWNKIEHRMFCHITQNWRGRPLVSLEVVVNLIGTVTTRKGLKIRAALDPGKDETGTKVKDHELALVRLERSDFQGAWNYAILPRCIVHVIFAHFLRPDQGAGPPIRADRQCFGAWAKVSGDRHALLQSLCTSRLGELAVEGKQFSCTERSGLVKR
jgi:hypothetical protein